jgi:hypothetical protein
MHATPAAMESAIHLREHVLGPPTVRGMPDAAMKPTCDRQEHPSTFLTAEQPNAPPQWSRPWIGESISGMGAGRRAVTQPQWEPAIGSGENVAGLVYGVRFVVPRQRRPPPHGGKPPSRADSFLFRLSLQ